MFTVISTTRATVATVSRYQDARETARALSRADSGRYGVIACGQTEWFGNGVSEG
jgi:hypothetical protein